MLLITCDSPDCSSVTRPQDVQGVQTDWRVRPDPDDPQNNVLHFCGDKCEAVWLLRRVGEKAKVNDQQEIAVH